MAQIDIVRGDIESIINVDNEFAEFVTYFQKVKTYNGDNSLKSVVNTEQTIQVNFHPESTDNNNIEPDGTITSGTAKVFFKWKYDDLIPKLEDSIELNNVKYVITQLKPWVVNGKVAYFEGNVTRDDLN